MSSNQKNEIQQFQNKKKKGKKWSHPRAVGQGQCFMAQESRLINIYSSSELLLNLRLRNLDCIFKSNWKEWHENEPHISGATSQGNETTLNRALPAYQSLMCLDINANM